MDQIAVYILANKKNGTTYVGVTSSLVKRVWHHKNDQTPGFASRYGCKRLVWYELHDNMMNAITREKQIKAGSRMAKGILISANNPDWEDLYERIL